MKKIKFNSPVILGFTILSAGALLLNYLTGGKTNLMFFSIYRTSFANPLLYLRLFTHVLGHTDLSHFSSNMLLFLLVGPLLEEKYGSEKILMIILVTAFVTGVVHIIMPGNTALLGASGIVFAFILLASITGKGRGIPLTMVIVAVIYLSQQLYQGIFVRDNISQLTHIIGGCTGAVFGLSMKQKR